MNNAPHEVKVDWGLLDVGFHSTEVRWPHIALSLFLEMGLAEK